MAERAINQRRAQFLKAFAPVSASLDELIREKLESGKFPLTKTGWTKIIAILVTLAGIALFYGQSWDVCENKPDWYLIVFPVCTGANIVVLLLFYMIFSFGCTVSYPGRWVTADIIANLLFGIIAIIGSVMTTLPTLKCRENVTMHAIPGPLGIAGGALSIIGCAAIFLMYRYVDDDDEGETPQTPMERNIDLRKSMHA
ncbi:hypothetical protein BDFB_005576 [Asbolus verrucosus]|uniref:MARVEL domain-containing protein n=1 Tax=Asbolus verrucosus TaxID=1661398 RepID=A0A482VJH6_ASBVE|nr:hypothetical protein BDFB_005576 [Asbolus verrucosus]